MRLALTVLLLIQGCAGAPGEAIVTPPPGPVPTPTDTGLARRPQPLAALSPLPLPIVRPAASPSAIALPLSVLVGRGGGDLRVGLDLVLEEQTFLSAAVVEAASGG